MQLKVLFTLLPALLAGGATAFIVPADIEPGLYRVDFDASGGHNITTIQVHDGVALGQRADVEGPITAATARRSSSRISKRDSQGGGGGSPFPNHADYNWCTDTMRNELNNGRAVGGKSIYFVVRGVVFLALCNYNNGAERAAGWEVTEFNAIMDRSYGLWTRGWWFRSGPNRTFWRDFAGSNICTNI